MSSLASLTLMWISKHGRGVSAGLATGFYFVYITGFIYVAWSRKTIIVSCLSSPAVQPTPFPVTSNPEWRAEDLSLEDLVEDIQVVIREDCDTGANWAAWAVPPIPAAPFPWPVLCLCRGRCHWCVCAPLTLQVLQPLSVWLPAHPGESTTSIWSIMWVVQGVGHCGVACIL